MNCDKDKTARRRKTGDIAIEVMQEQRCVTDSISLGDSVMLTEIFDRAKGEGILKGPGSRGGQIEDNTINRNTTVLNALDRDDRFQKYYWYWIGRNGLQRHVRKYVLKREHDSQNLTTER